MDTQTFLICRGGGRNGGGGGFPHSGERCNACLQWCRNTRTVTQVRLVTRPKCPPPYHETGVAIFCSNVFSVVSQTIAATPPLHSLKMAYRNPKTGLTRGVSQEQLASEGYRAVGGVARNSIANRAMVGHSAGATFFVKGWPKLKIILTTPHPHIGKKICPENMPYNGGLYGIKVG